MLNKQHVLILSKIGNVFCLTQLTQNYPQTHKTSHIKIKKKKKEKKLKN